MGKKLLVVEEPVGGQVEKEKDCGGAQSPTVGKELLVVEEPVVEGGEEK